MEARAGTAQSLWVGSANRACVQTFRQNLAFARGFKPMSAEEMQTLRERCFSMAADGRLELYMTTMKYDASIGRDQHGYPSQEQLPL